MNYYRNFVEQATLPACKCARPAIAVMDQDRWTDHGTVCTPSVNRCCTKCWQHWAGLPDAVITYSRKQWDAYVSQSFSRP